MLRHYLKTAIRSLARRKLYFAINTIGLSFGVAISLILFVFVINEWSFDRSHEKGDQIFRVVQWDYTSDTYEQEQKWWSDEQEGIRKRDVTLGVGYHLNEVLPEVKNATRFSGFSGYVKKDEKWLAERWHFVDSSFFEMFSFQVIDAEGPEFFRKIQGVVISKQTAQKYFGNERAIGKELFIATSVDGPEDQRNYATESSIFKVAAVVDVPDNSSIQFDFLIQYRAKKGYSDFSSDRGLMFNSGNRHTTFVELNAASDHVAADKKVNDELKEVYAQTIDLLRDRRKLSEANPVMAFELMPLKDVHFSTAVGNSPLQTKSRINTLILLSIGLLILFIVSINCVTLNLGTLGMRVNEFGVRKIVGAQKRQLSWQMYTEASIQLFIALLFAITIIQFLSGVFNNVTGGSVSLIGDWALFAALGLGLFAILSLVIGFFPLLVVFRMKLTQFLKGRNTYRVRPRLIKSVIGFQFALGLLLFVVVINMKDQLVYLLNKDMGFDKESVLVIEDLGGQSNLFKREASAIPGVENVSLTNSSLFAKGMFAIFWKDSETNKFTNVFMSTVDEEFMETLDIKLDSGRFFQNSPFDVTNSVLVNQTFYQMLKKADDFSGKYKDKQIVGVISDFNLMPLTKKVEPLVVNFNPSTSKGYNNAYIKLSGDNNVPEVIKSLETSWNRLYPDRLFAFNFLDEKISSEYATFEKMVNAVTYLSVLAIVFSCMGLFGLMSILVMNRLKEIGIRKVFGASISQIYLLLSRDFALMVLIAGSVIAYPAWRIMENWLENFAYTDNQFTSLFLIGVGVVTGLCLAIVSFHTLRTARINPVDYLRYE
ncbi:MAG: hypothetical protein HEP71_05230 [Roseivirga sp.]|nr:hypothetical protein [Roseivirga sp.]